MKIVRSGRRYELRTTENEKQYWQFFGLFPELALLFAIVWIPYALVRFVYRIVM